MPGSLLSSLSVSRTHNLEKERRSISIPWGGTGHGRIHDGWIPGSQRSFDLCFIVGVSVDLILIAHANNKSQACELPWHLDNNRVSET